MIINVGFQDLYYWDFIIPHSSGFFPYNFWSLLPTGNQILLCLSLLCAHANKNLKTKQQNKTLGSVVWEQTLEKVACMIRSLDNMPLNTGFSFQSVQFLFSFTLSSKGDSDCRLIVPAWNQSQMTQVFLSFILCTGIIRYLHPVLESCNSLEELKTSHFVCAATSVSAETGSQPSSYVGSFPAEGELWWCTPKSPSPGIAQGQGQTLRQTVIVIAK